MADSQKGILFGREWVGSREMDAVCFLAAGGYALLSPPRLSRKGGWQPGKEKQCHVTCMTGMAADLGRRCWGGCLFRRPVHTFWWTNIPWTLAQKSTVKREKACLHLETP